MKNWAAILARPFILFYTLPWLMVLLTLGTIAQKDMGIYTAQKIYFSSWILWLGPIPTPGAYTTLGLISICLLSKFLFFSPWSIKKSGIILSHLGIIILMVGGLLTAMTQREGFIMLGEGQSSQSISDYHQRVLTIKKDEEILKIIPFYAIQNNKNLAVDGLPFNIFVNNICKNCLPVMTENPDGRKGFAQKVELQTILEEKENEANLSGLTFNIQNAPDNQNGMYIAVEEIPMYPTISVDDHDYTFVMGRAQTQIPFSIALNDFEKEYHPGTNMARAYSSNVTITDGDVKWDTKIQMNEPLRYKGYTFYQSSFAIRPDGEFSILSAVENKGRVFPYIASAILLLGLLIHLILQSRMKKE